MKTYYLNVERITENLKKNALRSIMILVICSLVGVIYGSIQKASYKERDEIVFSGEEEVSLSGIEHDEQYYYNAFDMIKAEADCLDLYYRYFQNVNMSSESRDKLTEAKNTYNKFYAKYCDSENFFWDTPLAAEKKNETIGFYEYKIEELETKKTITSERYLKGIDSGSLSAADMQRLESVLAYIDIYIERLESLCGEIEDSPEEVIKNSNAEADIILEENVRSINENIRIFNELMREISSSENYNILINKYIFTDQNDTFGLLRLSEDETLLNNRLNSAIVYAKSVEGMDIGIERMYATITFFVLLGVILSVSYGAFHTPLDKKKG